MALLATVFALLSASPETFAITYERSGGLKPMPYRLAIRPGRHATLTTREALDERSHTVRFRVRTGAVERLGDALAQADFGTVGTPGPNPGVCADCFFYAIRYEGREVTFSQVAVPKRLREAVGLLERLVAAHRPRH